MGLGRILIGAFIGVGAIAAAPFTGGGSVLGAATFLGSLAGTAAVTTGAAAVGAAAGAVWDGAENDEKERAVLQEKKSSFEDGLRQGNIKAAKKFYKILEGEDIFKLGTFALAVCVSNLDGNISQEELTEINFFMGTIDKLPMYDKCRRKFKLILKNKYDFAYVRDKYLVKFPDNKITQLDDFVNAIINADNTITTEEKNFYKKVWKPYIKSRMAKPM